MADPTPRLATRDPAADGERGARRSLILIAAIGIAPIVASYAAHYLFRHDAQLNYGTLLPTAPAPAVDGTRPDGAAFRLSDLRGRWVMVQDSGGGCDAACERMLYATRQARTVQGREQERIVRVLLIADGGVPDAELLAQHPGLVIVRVAPGGAALPGAAPAVFVIDPLGNQVLRYGDAPDAKGIARDLARLLKASRIG